MANTRKVTVEVTDNGTLKQVAGEARKLNDLLDRTAQPRKVQSGAASAALSASGGSTKAIQRSEGLDRGTAGSQSRGDARDFGRQAQGLGGLVHLYATFAANVYAVSAAFNALSKAADFTNMQKAADILSLKVGVSINGLAKDMKNLTDGAISMADALGSASLASSAGLTTKQIKELTTVAKGASIALGRDMTDALQRVFRGTIKIEPELLDELGLMVKVDDANKAYAKTLGKTISTLTDYERRQAFVNAVTTQGINKYKELADQAANPFSKLLSTIKDLSTGVLAVMNSVLGPFVNMLSQSPVALLLGMTAIVGLLLKQAIPAIGNMRQAWIESSKAAQNAVASQIAAIEAKQKALVDARNEEKKSSQIALKETQSNLEKGLKKTLSTKDFSSLTSSINSLLWGKPGDIEANTKKAMSAVNSALNAIDEKIRRKEEALSKLGKTTDKELKKLQVQQTTLQSLAGDSGLVREMSLSAGQAAAANATTHAHEAALQGLKLEGEVLQHVANKRKALSAAYEKTELLGFRNGFAELNKEIAKLNLSPFEAGMLRLRGGLGALTISVGRLLGTFSVWGAAAAILLPVLGGITNALGLTTDHAAKLEESMTSLNSKLDLSKKISEDLKTAGDFHSIFELNAASANSFAESLDAVSESMKKYNDFKTNAGELTSFWEHLSRNLTLGSSGVEGSKAISPLLEEFDRRMATDKKFASANKGTFASTTRAGTNNTASTAYLQANAMGFGDPEEVIRKVFSALNDPKLKKDAKDYADTASGMSKNLKELNDISSDYIISITNQSKELKALNAFSASSAQAIKLLDKTNITKSSANIQEFLSGITDQFEEMSGISLPADLDHLRTALNRIQEDANNNYKTAMELAGSDPTKQKKATEDRSRSIELGSTSIINSYGGIEKVQQDYIGYSIKASKSLADLATTAGRASLAQTSLSAKLKETQFYGSFSKEGEARAIREGRKTEEKIADIQIKAEKTNAASIDAQKSNTEQQLRTAISLASKELFIARKNNDPAPLGAGPLKDQAIIALSQTDLNSSIAAQILTLVNSLESLGAASKIATLKIDSIKAALGKARESEARAEFKEIDAAADKKFKPEEEKLLEDLNNLEKKSQSIALLDSSYLSARLDSEIDLINAKTDILQYEKDLAIKIGEYDTIAKQLVADPNNKSIQDAAVGKARARDETFKKGEPLRDKPKAIQDKEAARVEKINLEITEKLSSSLSEQVDLASSYSSLLLGMNKEYSLIANYNAMGVSSLLEQDKLEQSILATKRAQLVSLATKGDDEAKAKLITLEQDALNSKLTKVGKLTEMFKQQDELTLKIIEKEGRWKDLFSGEGLNAALTLMADRIEETMGRSKSAMSQFVVGIVDAADTITDNFVTMLQKMDETKVSWVAFRDMVRNTFSDMFKNMATDILKNQIKSMMLSAMKMFGHDGRSNQEKAADTLGINLTTNSDRLATLNDSIRDLILNLYRQSPEFKEQQKKIAEDTENRFTTWKIDKESSVQERMLKGDYPGYSNNKASAIEVDKVETFGIGDQSLPYAIKIPNTFRTKDTIDSVVPSPVLNEVNPETYDSIQLFLNEKWAEAKARQMQGMQSSTPRDNSLSADVWVSSIDSLSLSVDKLGLLVEPKTAAQQSIPSTGTLSSDASSVITSDTLTSIDKLGDATSPVTVVLEELGVTVDRLTGTFGKLETIIPQSGINSSVGLNAIEPFKVDYSLANDKSGKLISKGGTEIKDASTNIKDGSYGILDASKILTDQLPNILGRYAGSGSAGGLGGSIVSILAKGALTYLMGPAGAVAGYAPSAAADQVAAGAIPFQYAKGGIMSQFGDVPLKTYSSGGIANSPQLALYGEGRKNEAYVPLPDNRTIPVTLSGGSGGTVISGDTNIKIEINNNSDTKVSVESAQQLSASLGTKVKAMVQEELMKQMKPRGILYADH